MRYTWVGLASQPSFIVAAFSPSRCYALMGDAHDWLPIACFTGGLALVAAMAALVARPAAQADDGLAPSIVRHAC